MVRSRLPQRVPPLHALVADEDVLQRVVERVAHVEAAGDVGRRDDDGVGPGADGGTVGAGIAAGERAHGLPRRVVFFLDLFRPIGLVQHRRDPFLECPEFRENAPARRTGTKCNAKSPRWVEAGRGGS